MRSDKYNYLSEKFFQKVFRPSLMNVPVFGRMTNISTVNKQSEHLRLLHTTSVIVIIYSSNNNIFSSIQNCHKQQYNQNHHQHYHHVLRTVVKIAAYFSGCQFRPISWCHIWILLDNFRQSELPLCVSQVIYLLPCRFWVI